MYHNTTHVNRIVQITLTQNDIAGNFLYRPYLPLTVLEPFPRLEQNFYSILQDKEKLYGEISTYDVEPTLVRVSKIWAQHYEKTSSNYRVDKLAEIMPILSRLNDLYFLLIDGQKHIKKLQIQLKKNLKCAQRAKRTDYKKYEEDISLKINSDCTLIIQIVHNSAGLFCLLKNVSKFNKKIL